MKICLQISMKKLRKKRYYIYHKNIKINNGNEKHPKKDKSKVTTWLAMEQICTKISTNNKAIIEYPHCRSVLI